MPDSEDEGRIVVVAGLARASDGTWWIESFDGGGHHRYPLQPLRIILRLMREPNGLMRGTIELPSADLMAPFHSNQQIIDLLHAWLGRDEHHRR